MGADNRCGMFLLLFPTAVTCTHFYHINDLAKKIICVVIIPQNVEIFAPNMDYFPEYVENIPHYNNKQYTKEEPNN